jgi:predicted O-linked N-acetylglucosamine transferase (SPINDLY family)
MATISQAFAIAVQHHQAGRLDLAEQIYRKILAAEPDHADALHLLGLAAYQAGRYSEALERMIRAAALNPAAELYQNHLGLVYQALGRVAEAVAAFRRAVALNPRAAGVYCNLGSALCDGGEFAEAASVLRQALQLEPGMVEAHTNLGNALRAQGRLAEAATCYRTALELAPGYAPAANNLGNVLHAQGMTDEAIACYRQALQLQPNQAMMLDNLATALLDQHRRDEALACYRRALELEPGYALGYNNLGAALAAAGQFDEAIACYGRALELQPGNATTRNNLGNALRALGRLDEAIACYRQALELQPDFAIVYSNLGSALKDQGRLDEALQCFRQALDLRPELTEAHHNLLFTLHYCAEQTPATLAEAHAAFQRQHARPLQAEWAPHANSRDPDRRLRLGFVSPDFGQHPVGRFLVRVLEHLAPAADITCYSDRPVDDELTTRLRAAAACWHDSLGWSDVRLAEQIRREQIDILFDLAGHTAKNRLLTFARKPAPVQVTWIGYEGSTGLSAIDYLIADRHMVTPADEQYCAEQVLRMPDSYLCFDPPAEAPAAGPLPALSRGQVTFASFSNLAKINSQVIDAWAEILGRVPRARLLLNYWGLGDESLRAHYRRQFADRGVDPGRLDLRPPSSYAEYLAVCTEVDLVLDPFPFSGCATTCEALWMGLPVVTWPGATFASRHSLSILSAIGLAETVAHSRAAYVDLAVGLAEDRARLAHLRAALRGQMAASPLCDGKQFAENLMALLREAWHAGCARP